MASYDDQTLPEARWIEAGDNPWGVRLLDVRPITLGMLSASADAQAAENVMSFAPDDGADFVGKSPAVSRAIDVSLTFPIDRALVDGALFIPREMEHKWAIFFHGGEIVCVRSWRREVQLVAQVELRGDRAEIRQIQGTLVEEEEEPGLTAGLFDYLLRSHALDTTYPVPLPKGMESAPKAAAMWCMNRFGNQALFATPDRIERQEPEKPLRTDSLLHIAATRGQTAEVEAHLSAGVPVDLLAANGHAPLHWAVGCEDTKIMDLLLDCGSPVDVRSSTGATPLMTAAESSGLDQVQLLLARGADANACDRRGFTALHRAAEMGRVDAVRALLAGGAIPTMEADGHTARSLAEGCQHEGVLALLDEYEGSGR